MKTYTFKYTFTQNGLGIGLSAVKEIKADSLSEAFAKFNNRYPLRDGMVYTSMTIKEKK